MFIRIAFLFSMLACGHLYAQILRVDKGAMLADSSGYVTGSLALDIAINDRNSTAEEKVIFTSARGKGDIAYVSEQHVYYLISDVRYFKSTGGPLQSTGFAHMRSNLMRRQRLSYELFAQGQYDQGRNLEERLLGGGGLRLRLTENLAIGTGIMQELERWETLSDEALLITKDLTKSTSYISGDIPFSQQVGLFLTAYYQTGYDPDISTFRHRISASSRLAISVGKRLDWSIRYTIAYEDRPIIPISKSVYSFSNGVRYSF